MIGNTELDRVLFLISWWLTAIKSHNAINLYDINKIAEGVALKVLNEIYDLQLENLNYERRNYPGIDLGDKAEKICFQITSSKSIRKIRKNLKTYVRGLHKIYSNGIRFLILSQDKKPVLNKDMYQEICPNFEPDKHIVNADDLIKEIHRIYDSDKEKFYRIKEVLEIEITGKAMKKRNLCQKVIFEGRENILKNMSWFSSSVFVGRQSELEKIKTYLATTDAGRGSDQVITGLFFFIEGAGGIGKTALAYRTAKLYKDIFRDGVVSPFRVDALSPMTFSMLLGEHFGYKVKEPSDPYEAQILITQILEDRQALVILDNADDWGRLKFMLPIRSSSVVLVTTRNREFSQRMRLEFMDEENIEVHEISLECFSEEETLQLFHKVLGNDFKENEKDIYMKIAQILGFLPIALRQALPLMVFCPRYSASMLLEKLALDDCIALLQRGQTKDDTSGDIIESVFNLSSSILTAELVAVLEYLAICSTGPVPLDFMQQLSQDDEIGERLELLYSLSWLECREISGNRYYELNQLVRQLIRRRFGSRFQREFLDLVYSIFIDDSIGFSKKDQLMPQLKETFRVFLQSKDWRLNEWMNRLSKFFMTRGYWDFYLNTLDEIKKLYKEDYWILKDYYNHRAAVFHMQGYFEKAFELYHKQEKLSEQLNDPYGLGASINNQGLIFKDRGENEKALNYIEKAEAIFVEIGSDEKLADCYGNHALVLRNMGKMKEAMRYHKKEGKICVKVGDQRGLAGSYLNQSLILSSWGRLEEAMELNKKSESICKTVGDKYLLSLTLGNRVSIYQRFGMLDEAMMLLKENERICLEMENLHGLLNSYNNQGAILSEKELWIEAIKVLKKSEEISLKTGNKVRLASAYGKQAAICFAQKKMNEAMKFEKKREALSIELNNFQSLSLSYSMQAKILGYKGKIQGALELHKKEEEICEKINDKIGLSRSYWNQGLIYKKMNMPRKMEKLCRKSIKMDKDIGIPIDKHESYLNFLLMSDEQIAEGLSKIIEKQKENQSKES